MKINQPTINSYFKIGNCKIKDLPEQITEPSASRPPGSIIGLGHTSIVPETPPEPDQLNRTNKSKTG